MRGFSREMDLSFGKPSGHGQGVGRRGCGIVIPRVNDEAGGCRHGVDGCAMRLTQVGPRGKPLSFGKGVESRGCGIVIPGADGETGGCRERVESCALRLTPVGSWGKALSFDKSGGRGQGVEIQACAVGVSGENDLAGWNVASWSYVSGGSRDGVELGSGFVGVPRDEVVEASRLKVSWG